jgi:hypothetical protein
VGTDRAWSPGTVKLLQDEAVRLADIAVLLDDLAEDLWSRVPEGWAGRAADAYEELRGRLVKQCRSGVAAYEAASGALENYVQILVELGGRRRFETASDALARLEQQRVEAAGHLETAWRTASDEFEAIRKVLPELGAVPVPAMHAPAVRTGPPPDREAPAPRLGEPRYVQDLSDALLDHWERRT